MYMGRPRYENHVVGTLLDASKAFCRMFRPRLLDKLHKEGVKGRLFKVIVAYFGERFQRVRVGEACSAYDETKDGGRRGLLLFYFLG